MVAVPVGAFADPTFPAPKFSVYEHRKHPWVVVLGEAVEHSSTPSVLRNPGSGTRIIRPMIEVKRSAGSGFRRSSLDPLMKQTARGRRPSSARNR